MLSQEKLQDAFQKLIRSDYYLNQQGWFLSSITESAVDMMGLPLPWYTYSAIAFILPRIKKNWTLLEFGSGNSTLWWSERVYQILSVEHDENWFSQMQAKIPGNVELRHVHLEYGGEYSKVPLQFTNLFDVIIIDGRDRVNCAKNSLASLKHDGVIIWDNSDRDDYAEGYTFLINNGFRRIDFWGMGPINAIGWCTSVFYRTENCMGI